MSARLAEEKVCTTHIYIYAYMQQRCAVGKIARCACRLGCPAKPCKIVFMPNSDISQMHSALYDDRELRAVHEEYICIQIELNIERMERF